MLESNIKLQVNKIFEIMIRNPVVFLAAIAANGLEMCDDF